LLNEYKEPIEKIDLLIQKQNLKFRYN